MARSVISTSIANSVSCMEKQRSARETLPAFSPCKYLLFVYVTMPENDTSMPFTT